LINFLILIESILNYSKHDIDLGHTPKIIIQLCLCLKEAFFLTKKIRKCVNFYIYIIENEILIKFEGKKLKYLGPDERSQSILLEKALQKNFLIKNSNSNIFIKSTPGIFVKKTKFEVFIKNQKDVHTLIVLKSSLEEKIEDLEVITEIKKCTNPKSSIFICILNCNKKKIDDYITDLKSSKRIIALDLLNKKNKNLSYSDQILFINHYFDEQEV
jgi:tRNA pseudouridine-54 N-methylase